MTSSQWMPSLTRRTLIRSAGLLAGAVSLDTVLAEMDAAQDGARPLLLAHTMPGYQSRPQRGTSAAPGTMAP